jgi:hypothetical protein
MLNSQVMKSKNIFFETFKLKFLKICLSSILKKLNIEH